MKLGIPYMGSKRKLASEILKVITQRHEGISNFYDLFGGGGSVSFTALKNYKFKTHYNELNKHIFSLVEYLKNNKSLDAKFYEWIDRETFFEQVNKPNEEADWFSGFAMSCWSFGNNQKSYLYGENIQEDKFHAHNLIVNKDLNSMKSLNLDIPEIINIETIQKRKSVFCSIIEKKYLQEKSHLRRVQHIQQLQNIEDILKLDFKEKFSCSNLSFENVEIVGENPIIYCDIPYKNTGKYKEDEFNHDKFYQWASEVDFPVYVSEYNSEFQEVHAFKHNSSLSATNNSKQVIERLFWNGKGEANKHTLF